MKNFIKFILAIMIISLPANCAEILKGNLAEDTLFNGAQVRVTSINKITTSKKSLVEGSKVNFVVVRDVIKDGEKVIKKGSLVEGEVVLIVPNRFISIPAKIVIEEFTTEDIYGNKVRLKGSIRKDGNDHNNIVPYINLFTGLVRGGEVQIRPEEDYFILFY